MVMIRGGGGGGFRHGADLPKAKNPWKSLHRIIPWVAPFWPILVFGFLCMFLNTFASMQPPRLFQHMIDHTLKGAHYEEIPRMILLLLGVYLSIQLTGFLRTYWLHVAGQKMLHGLRRRLYEHFQKLSLTFYDNRQTGDLMSRMTSDIEQIENIMVHGLDVLVMGLFGMILAFYYMFGYNRELALLVLIPIPVIAVSIFFFSGKVRAIYRGIRDRIGAMNAKLQENLSGIRVIKAFSREETELAHVTETSEQVLHMNIRGIRLWTSFGPAMGLLGMVGSLIVFGVGAYQVKAGLMEVGALVAFLLFVNNFYQPIGQLFGFFDSIQRSLAGADRILEVLDTVPDVADPADPVALDDVRGEVEFRNVTFSYASTGEVVLCDVNVTARPGERIALVGRSGAGKSSFINLIPRFYDAMEGSVLIDGIDVRTMRQTDLRKYIALVLQETFLFNGSVRENLRYGKLDATDEELEDAAQIANAHEFIVRLHDGYDTEIGERGVKLSGGQKQRLAIARAVLADPRILILDEATSSVDSESEFLIHQALDRLMEGRTTFIIAHRLSTIRNADIILVLENGVIVERGSHNELLRADGPYARMYRQQFWLDEMFKDEAPELPPKEAVEEAVNIPTLE
jgi:ABC-type multidrug transport system fused ATPase/permease subunit